MARGGSEEEGAVEIRRQGLPTPDKARQIKVREGMLLMAHFCASENCVNRFCMEGADCSAMSTNTPMTG